MAVYTAELSDGRKVDVEADHRPSEEEILAAIGGGGVSKPAVTAPVGLSDFIPTENKIAARPDLIKSFIDETNTNPYAKGVNLNSFKNAALQPFVAGLKGVGGVMQRGEAAVANPLMDLQEGNANPSDLLNSIVKGIQGKRLGELGDIPRRAGFGEPASTLIGMGSLAGITNLLTAGKVAEAGDVAMQEGKQVAGEAGAQTAEALQKRGENVLNTYLKPTKGEMQFGRNPSKEMLERGIQGTPEELPFKVQDEITKVGQERKLLMNSPDAKNTLVDLSSNSSSYAFKHIDDTISRLETDSPRQNASVIQKLKNMKDDWLHVNPQTGAGDRLNSIPLADAVNLKDRVGNSLATAWNLSNDENIVNNVVKKTYGDIKRGIESSAPFLKPINDSMSNLLALKEASTRAWLRTIKSAQPVSLGDAGTGAMASLLTHSNPVGMVAAIANRYARSPMGKLRRASTYYKTGSLLDGILSSQGK